GTQAEVDAAAETEVVCDVSVEVELVGAIEAAGIPVGGAEQQEHAAVGGNLGVSDAGRAYGGAEQTLDGRVPPHGLLDRPGHEVGSAPHQLPLIGELGECQQD